MTLPLDRLRGIVADKILDAAELAAQRLRDENIPFAICGGLAVSAHGYERTTKDVDFLVGDEAFVHFPGGLVTLKVPIFQIDGVAIDFVSADDITRGTLAVTTGGALPVVAGAVLAYMKLAAGRLRDTNDLVELVRLGKLDPAEVRVWLSGQAPKHVPKWDAIVGMAETSRE